jgi:hypothetical protein
MLHVDLISGAMKQEEAVVPRRQAEDALLIKNAEILDSVLEQKVLTAALEEIAPKSQNLQESMMGAAAPATVMETTLLATLHLDSAKDPNWDSLVIL